MKASRIYVDNFTEVEVNGTFTSFKCYNLYSKTIKEVFTNKIYNIKDVVFIENGEEYTPEEYFSNHLNEITLINTYLEDPSALDTNTIEELAVIYDLSDILLETGKFTF